MPWAVFSWSHSSMGSSKCEAQGACCALPSLLPSSPWVPGAALCGCPAQGLGRCCQLPFPSCCWRQEQFFSSPQHNKWFRWFSASLAVVWDQTPTRLGVVHILKEQSMPLATYIFFPMEMDGCSRQTRRAEGDNESKSSRWRRRGACTHTQGPGRLCSWRRLSGAANN